MLTNVICWLVQMTVSMNVDRFKIDKGDTEKLLGVKFDKKLTFDDHISDICKKAGRKIPLLWPELHHTWELRGNTCS